MRPRLTILLFSICLLPLRGEEPHGSNRNSGFPADTERVTIPIKDTLIGPSVEVLVNGKAVQLILDTGAGTTLLTPQTADRLGLEVRESSIRGVPQQCGLVTSICT